MIRGIRPEAIAHDLHPDYASTRYALARPEAAKVAVQHHHVVVVDGQALEARRTVVRDVDRDGLAPQPDGDRVGEQPLVLDDQHTHPSAPPTTPVTS